MPFNDNVTVQVGDMVTPRDEDEFLFLDLGTSALKEAPTEIFWNGSVGVVLEVGSLKPQKSYRRVRIMVDGVIGWTYSDYLQIVRS